MTTLLCPGTPTSIRIVERSTSRLLCMLIIVCLLFDAAPGANGQDGSASETGVPLLYRKIFVPEDSIRSQESVSTRGDAYYPIERKEFEQLLGEVRVKHLAPELTLDARITQGVYKARLGEPLVMTGTAQLSITHVGQEATSLPLKPLNLAISQPIWVSQNQGEPDPSEADGEAAETPRAAQVGVDQSGRTSVLVNQSGTLQFDWSLRGREDVAGDAMFDFQLPAGTVNSLELELPNNRVPVAESAVVAELEHEQEAGASRQWRILFGRDASTQMTIGPPNRRQDEQALVMLRQQSTFQFAVTGTDLVTVLSLDVYQQPLSHLTLELDRELHLVSAQQGTTALTWTETEAASRKRITLEFASPLSGVNQEIVLRAVSAGSLGKLWKLPHVHATGVLWLEGTTALEIPDTLVVDEILTTDCRQTDVGPLAAPRRGELIHLQDFQPLATAQILVRPRDVVPTARTGTTIELGTVTTNLVYVAEILSHASPDFLLEIDGDVDWQIDRLETKPPGLLDDWTTLRRGSRRRTIQVRLKQPLAAISSMRLVVHAHQNGLRPSEVQTGADLRLGQLKRVDVTEHLISLAAESPHQLRMIGDTELARLSIDELDDADRELLSPRPGGVVFLDDAATNGLTVSLSASPPNFRADIEIDADLREDHVNREFTILCTPESSSVDRIRVQFNKTLGQEPRWTWLDDPLLSLQTKQVETSETAADLGARGDTWSIVLPGPQDKPFRIRAEGSDSFGEEASIPLVSVLGASPQTGSVTIRSTDAVPIEIVPQDLSPIPASAPPPDRYTTTRGVYRYEPSLEGRLYVHRADSQQQDLANVWACRLDSRLYQEGQGVHTARFFIENNGLPRIQLTVPGGVDLLSVRIDEDPIQLSSDLPLRARLKLPLPAGRRFPVLVVDYSMRTNPLGNLSRVEAPWLEVDLPTFQREWVVWLPPGFDVQAEDSDDRAGAWRQRLFGPVLRPAGRRRFNPLSGRDWRSLLQASESPSQDDSSTTLADRGGVRASAIPNAWAAEQAKIFAEDSIAGWSAHQMFAGEQVAVDGLSPAATSVTIIRADFIKAVSWAVFLAATGLGGWITHRRALLGLPLILFVGCAALIAPLTVSPILASCFLGTLLASALSPIRPFQTPQKPEGLDAGSSSASIVVMQTVTSTVAVLVILWLSASLATAQESSAPRSDTSSETVYRVLYPIDDQQNPLGPYVYVPRDFLAALERSEPREGAKTRQWTIQNAVYRAVFEWDVAEERLVVREVVADWRLATFRDDVQILLPMTQDEAYLLPDRARLDGQRASVNWEANGTGLTVSIPRTGPARLVLAFRPRVTNGDGLSRFDIAIPPLPNAQARLQLPRDALGVRCPTALGGSTQDNQIGERVVRLGPTDRLVAEWSDDPYFDAGPSGLEASQLTWLRIRPGSVVFQAKFVLSCLAGEIREAELVVDPGLRMLPTKPDGPIAEYHVHNDGTRLVHMEFQPPYDQEIAFDVDFVVTGASGIGSIRPPQLELSADRTNRHWMGISVDPALQFDAPTDLSDRVIDPSEFVAAWGTIEEPPELAMSVPNGSSDITLATRPREPRLNTSEQLSVSCTQETARLLYQADIEVVEGSCFQYRLFVPTGVDVHSITISEEGDQFEAQWARRKPGEIIVRIKKPMANVHRLTMQADMPIAKKTRVSLPRIRLNSGSDQAYEVRLYRQSQVELTDVITSGYEPIEGSGIGRYVEGSGRLIAAVRIAPENSTSATISFVPRPNRPRTRGTLLIFLRRESDAWQVETLYELEVQAGVVDALRFEIPAAWTEPLQMDFAAHQEMIDIPDQDRKYLVLRPETPVTTTTRFRISGELTSRPGEQVRAPDIIPLDVRQAERYLIAPETIGQKEVTWVTNGLRAMQLPARFADQRRPNEETYLANQPRFQASIEKMKQESGVAGVALADFHLDCGGDGSVRGVATFDVLPAGRSSCQLELPESCELIHASVDGAPALLKQLQARQWQLQLGSPQLPQQVQVIFQGHLAADPEAVVSAQLPAPALVDFPVERTLWTVQPPDGVPIVLDPAESRIDAWSQEVTRFDRDMALVESASGVLEEIDPAVARKWYLPWMRRVAASRGRLHRWADQRADLGQRQAEQLAAIDVRYEGMIARLTEADLIATSELRTDEACRPADVWAAALVRERAALPRLAVAGQPRVRIESQQSAAGERHPWLPAVAVLIACAAFPLLQARATEKWGGWILGPTLLIAGCVWWSWCEPSPLGLVLALVGACLWTARSFFQFQERNSAFRLGTK